MSFDLSSLNAEQIKPVLDTDGAVLVTAGAGSGKTRLLTHRIAHLIENKDIPPYNILAITFTNKAANEMRERLNKMVPNARGLWVSTFHSMCVSILRKFIDQIGYTASFSIYGEYEKDKTIKRLLKENHYNDEDIHKEVSAAISDAKNEGLSPQDYYNQNNFMNNAEAVLKIFTLYEQQLKSGNALDFDDLLNKAYELLKNCREAGDYYAEKFRYIHVDEFQDTNTIQYKIVKQLSRIHKNVMIVGDEDQSIYGWRGANISNIHNFVKDFNAKIYKLEQNYRSTKEIIEMANKLIANNSSRIKKVLWTANDEGDKIKFIAAPTDSAEAETVVGNILSLMRDDENLTFSDFAVLMRINALTRSFEEKFMQYNIPHKVFGGFRFYERKEIKDILAYLRIIVNPYDNEAITRVINFPKRGIGAAAIDHLTNYCINRNCALFDGVMATLQAGGGGHSAAITKKVSPFAAILQCLIKEKDVIKHSELIKYLIQLLNLKEEYKADTEENENRKQNIKELVNSVVQFETINPDASVEEYLQTVSLYSDTDEMREDDDKVTLATIHSAKGLEFNTVFVVGLEKGIFPGKRVESTADMEEERRLMYVAVTRAQRRLFVSYAASRFLYNERNYTVPSPFLEEMGYSAPIKPQSMYESYNETRWYNRSYSGGNRGYEDDDYGYNNSYTSNSGESIKPAVPQPPPTAKRNDCVDFSRFKTGTHVLHKKFGTGVIVSISGDDENSYALVEFEKYGKLTLSLTYAPLEVIEE